MKNTFINSDPLCLYTQHKSDIEKGIIVNLNRRRCQGFKRRNIDKYSGIQCGQIL